MESHAHVIEAFGGITRLAQTIGVKPALANHWAKRGIPAKFWDDVAEAARRMGLYPPVTVRWLKDTKPVGVQAKSKGCS